MRSDCGDSAERCTKMNSTESAGDIRRAHYRVVIPLSMAGALIGVSIACMILTIIIFTKRMHTVTHLLICNSSISSIFFCIVQCVNYIFLSLLPWKTDDLSCRWRAYFGYMSVVAVVYSYLAQAVSRFLLAMLSVKYRWASAMKTHVTLIIVQWLLVALIPTPALLTKDIYYRPYALCWVPKEFRLHLAYSVIAYYLLPALFIFAIYISIYCRVKRRRRSVFISRNRRGWNRDLEVLYNIMILFATYTLGAIPTILYILTGMRYLYEIGIVSVSFTVAVEKLATLLLDRDMRNFLRMYCRRSMTQVRPIT